VDSSLSPLKLHHAGVVVDDWEAAVRLYEEALGLSVKVGWRVDGSPVANVGTQEGTCFEVIPRSVIDGLPDWPEAYAERMQEPVIHICLRTDDVDAAYERAVAAGMKTIWEPRDIEIETTSGLGEMSVRLVFLEGPGGEVIELLQGDKLPD
jgi:catechol 2,3-dioxygenase-like lactoylglutathione lyase family enzyme